MRIISSLKAATMDLVNLPLAPNLTHFLNPDPVFPTPASVRALPRYSTSSSSANDGETKTPAELAASVNSAPSMLRRARMIRQGGNFSYVTPLPLEFPYNVPDIQECKNMDIESYLASLEPDLRETPLFKSTNGKDNKAAYSSKLRNRIIPKPQLLSVSTACRDDIFPQLDISSQSARDQLAEILGGRAILLTDDNDKSAPTSLTPWSLCYGGHQFGVWAGQLGDGRATSIFTTPAKYNNEKDTLYYPPVAELQLKGSGRTPFSRFADGLAVLRSSIREYLGAEACAALTIPTSRSLALVHYPDTSILRERVETGAVVTRVAPSWLRIGNFEILRQNSSWDSLRKLVQYTAKDVLGISDNKDVAKNMLHDVARRNGITIAKWQAYGFMHGVMNSDNISVLGLTIDYGPYAWMDTFDKGHICNHSDEEGRYSYLNQPAMGAWAIKKLGEALQDIIGAEEIEQSGYINDNPGWFEKGNLENKVDKWREAGLREIDEAIKTYNKEKDDEYLSCITRRLGLHPDQKSSAGSLATQFFSILEDYNLDMSHSFRSLAKFTSVIDGNNNNGEFVQFLDQLAPKNRIPHFLQSMRDETFTQWFKEYEQARSEANEKFRQHDEVSFPERIRRANPRFVLRQWVLEEVIERVQSKNDLEFLEKVMEMCQAPFEGWGEDGKEGDGNDESRRLCGTGPQNMLGFQCSCSS